LLSLPIAALVGIKLRSREADAPCCETRRQQGDLRSVAVLYALAAPSTPEEVRTVVTEKVAAGADNDAGLREEGMKRPRPRPRAGLSQVGTAAT